MRRRTVPTNVVLLHTKREADTIAVLQDLLSKALAGQLHGLVFVAKTGQAGHLPGATGDYRRDPLSGIGACQLLMTALEDLAD